jgi:hypothetical protein
VCCPTSSRKQLCSTLCCSRLTATWPLCTHSGLPTNYSACCNVLMSLSFRYSDSWIARRTIVFIVLMWSTSTIWSVLPFILKQLDIIFQCSWYDYMIIYGFYGFPLIAILSMNLAIFITVATMNTNTSGINSVSQTCTRLHICAHLLFTELCQSTLGCNYCHGFICLDNKLPDEHDIVANGSAQNRD